MFWIPACQGSTGALFGAEARLGFGLRRGLLWVDTVLGGEEWVPTTGFLTAKFKVLQNFRSLF